MAKSRQLVARSVIGAFVATTLALAGKVQAAPLAMGPVEQVNVRSSIVVVLGRTYHVGPATSIVSNAARTRVALSSITPGTLVVIDGTESATGAEIVQRIAILPEQNVPGATQLLVTGVVTSATSTGQVRIGKLAVDINATLTDDSQRAWVGELIQAFGTQPNPGGLFLAQSAIHVAGIGGSGDTANGIGGSGPSAKGGSGVTVNGIGGSGL